MQFFLSRSIVHSFNFKISVEQVFDFKIVLPQLLDVQQTLIMRPIKRFFLLFLVTASISEMFAENNKCPERCVDITKCPFYATILSGHGVPRPRHVINLIWKNYCGVVLTNKLDVIAKRLKYEKKPKVCCPDIATLEEKESARIPPDVTDHKNLKLLPLDTCGPVLNDYRITSGSAAIPMEFPWMALIAYIIDGKFEFRCGGSLINERYVLTAAHCIRNFNLAGVRLGEYNINTIEDCNLVKGTCAPPVQDFFIEDVMIHPDYEPNNFKNDVALVRLATPANFTYENVKPICLPIGNLAKVDLTDTFAVISGWGVSDLGFKSAQLLKTSVPVMSHEQCQKVYMGRSAVSYRQLCAGGYMGQDSCGGDSGGPLKYIRRFRNSARFFQYGIVSYGPRQCGIDGQPGIYTGIIYYMDWILDNLKPD